MERFGNASHDDIKRFMDKSKNKNTTKVTVTWMNVYHTWAKHRGEVLEIVKLEPKKLDKILHFFTELNKQDGQGYEPNPLSSMQASIYRHLCERGYTPSILKSREFASLKAVLEGKAQVAKMEKEGGQI